MKPRYSESPDLFFRAKYFCLLNSIFISEMYGFKRLPSSLSITSGGNRQGSLKSFPRNDAKFGKIELLCCGGEALVSLSSRTFTIHLKYRRVIHHCLENFLRPPDLLLKKREHVCAPFRIGKNSRWSVSKTTPVRASDRKNIQTDVIVCHNRLASYKDRCPLFVFFSRVCCVSHAALVAVFIVSYIPRSLNTHC